MPEPTVHKPYSFAPYQDALGNDYFDDDPDLQAMLRHHGLSDEASWARVAAYGKFAASSALEGADSTDRADRLPQLVAHDAYGQPHPVGVQVPQATRRILAAALRAGAATEPNVFLRYGMAYLGAQVGEAGVTCPLACTDGMVRAINELDCGPQAKAARDHILTQAPGGPVHAAQFVTEIQGGSDAGTNAVEARPQGDGSYRLFGTKWFCSNPWAQYWAVTARPEGAPDGPRGVALFLVPRVTEDGQANHFRLDRLKDKLGTRSLPTAEVTLSGARSWPIGDLRAGLSNMVSIVLTTSRFWNAMAAAASMRAAERIVHSYARFRHAFGRPIESYPLVAHTLDTLTEDRRHYTAAFFEVLVAWERVLAAQRAGGSPAAEDALRCRILVMLAKTCATRRSTQRIHDAMMVLGGNGIEERFSPLPRLWRDSAILETWEGPHGLLLGRCLSDLRTFGGAEDPEAFVGVLLGEGASAEDRRSLGQDLDACLQTEDPRAQMLAFRSWAERFYDRFGAAAWQRVAHRAD